MADAARVPAEGVPECTVYFPGTYPNPVTIDGPTLLRVGHLLLRGHPDHLRRRRRGRRSAAVRSKVAPTISTPPSTPSTRPPRTTSTASGRTFVFGKSGRLVVDNARRAADQVAVQQALRGRRRRRRARPSAGVSIMSVNGKLGADGITGEHLLIPNVLEVPLSNVGAPTPPVAATTQKYLPSMLVPPPESTVPDPPTELVATGYLTSMQVSWTAPVNNGGSKIDAYTVRVASPAGEHGDVRDRQRDDVRGHRPARRLTNYTFTVEATNAVGHLGALGARQPSSRRWPSRPPHGSPGVPCRILPAHIADHRLRADRPRPRSTSRCPATCPSRRAGSGCSNPNAHPVVVNGGVLAASFDIADPRGPVPIGLENAIAQGTFKIVSQTDQRVSAHGVERDRPGQPGRRLGVNTWEVQAD